MFRFLRSGHLEPDQNLDQQQRQPLLQSDQVPYQSSYDSISENEVVICLMVNRFVFSPIKAHSLYILHTYQSIQLLLVFIFTFTHTHRRTRSFVLIFFIYVWLCLYLRQLNALATANIIYGAFAQSNFIEGSVN